MDRENRHLRFVLKHYTPGVFDTRKAIRIYKESHPATFRLWTTYVAAAAAVVAVCLTVGYFLFTRPAGPVVLYSENTKAVYMLPDSTRVTLYPHSSLSYHPDEFGGKQRNVDMRGKVEFKVTRNPQSPFVATASLASVRVLGTQFTVDETTADSIAVEVTSGKVLFTAKGESDGLVLTKGMNAYLLADNDRPVLEDKADDKSRTAAPRKFVFDNAPLADVLAELSAHFKVKLTCPATDKRLTAEFDSAELDEIIMVIEKSLNVKIKKEQQK